MSRTSGRPSVRRCVLALLVLAGCGEPPVHAAPSALGDAGLVAFAWDSEAGLRVGASSLVVTLTHPDGVALDDASLEVALAMPAHGHGPAGSIAVEALGAGRHRVHGFSFQMPGRWHLRLDAIAPGVRDAATFVLDVR